LQKFCGEVGYASCPEPNLEVYPFTFARRERLKKARTSASKIAIRIRLVEKTAAARASAHSELRAAYGRVSFGEYRVSLTSLPLQATLRALLDVISYAPRALIDQLTRARV